MGATKETAMAAIKETELAATKETEMGAIKVTVSEEIPEDSTIETPANLLGNRSLYPSGMKLEWLM